MSDCAAFIELSPDGASIVSCRLLAPDGHGQPEWHDLGGHAGGFDISALASDIAGRLPDPALERLVVGSPGSRCHWLAVPSADPGVVRGAVAQGRPASWGEWSSDTEDPGMTTSVLDAGAVALQALADPELRAGAGVGPRVGAVALPDLAVRALLDELDALRVRVLVTTTLWHALANAWDPGAVARTTPKALASPEDEAEPVVSVDPPTAVVAFVERSGRREVVWTWSRSGRLVAGGSSRVRSLEGASARVATDWLGWAAQVGFAPDRVVAMYEQDAFEAGEVRRALEAIGGDLAVDAAGVEDVVGATVERLARRGSRAAGLATDPRVSVTALAERPGRVHRSAYLWVSVAMVCLAVVVGVIGQKQRARAAALSESTREAEQAWRGALAEQYPEIAGDAFPRLVLEDKVQTLIEKKRTANEDTPKAFLQELDTLAFVLFSEPGIILLDANFTGPLSVTHRVLVPDLETGEALPEMLNGASRTIRYDGRFLERPTQVLYRGPEYADHVEMELTGRWVEPGAESDGGSS